MKKLELLKKWLSQYRKIVIDSFIVACSTRLSLSAVPAVLRIKSIEAGTYPEEPIEIISRRLQEMRPVIIMEAVAAFFLFTAVYFVIQLYVRFKRKYNINFFQKFKKILFSISFL